MDLLGPDDTALVNLADVEPYRFSVVGPDGRIHPITKVTYSYRSITLEWSDKDRAEILEAFNTEIWGPNCPQAEDGWEDDVSGWDEEHGY